MNLKIETSTQELSSKEKRKLYLKEYYQNNKDKISLNNKKFCKQNSGHIKKRNTRYYIKNKEKYIEYYNDKKEKYTAYYDHNKKEIKQRIALYAKKKYNTNPVYKLQCLLRSRLLSGLKSKNIRKTNSIFNLIGCSIQDCKNYIERQWLPGMSWENYNYSTWHVDHIKPVNTFDLTDPEQQKQCFHYTNLRPLWAKDNLSRPKDGRDL
jgi:hypothetical protein